MNILGEVCVVVLYRARRVVSCFCLAAGAEEILCIERERRMYEMSDDAVDVRGMCRRGWGYGATHRDGLGSEGGTLGTRVNGAIAVRSLRAKDFFYMGYWWVVGMVVYSGYDRDTGVIGSNSTATLVSAAPPLCHSPSSSPPAPAKWPIVERIGGRTAV